MSASLDWRSAFLSHRGSVRTINEDAFLEAPDLRLWAVADGMGGHEGGQIASRITIESLDRISDVSELDSLVERVCAHLNDANRSLRAISVDRFSGRPIGSTVAVLLGGAPRFACVWAGDSRIYLLRRQRLMRLTKDHSRVQELIDSGVIEPDEPSVRDLRNVITRAVGADDELLLETMHEDTEAGDVFVLCTDGLSTVVPEADIVHCLEARSPSESAASLLHIALGRGAPDNVTVGVVEACEAVSDDVTVPRR